MFGHYVTLFPLLLLPLVVSGNFDGKIIGITGVFDSKPSIIVEDCRDSHNVRPLYLGENALWRQTTITNPICFSTKEDLISICRQVYPKNTTVSVKKSMLKLKTKEWCPMDWRDDECYEKTVYPFFCSQPMVESIPDELTFEEESNLKDDVQINNALISVPKGCKFKYIHQADKCESKESLEFQAKTQCGKLRSLSDGVQWILNKTAMGPQCPNPMNYQTFYSIEFICCPIQFHEKLNLIVHVNHHNGEAPNIYRHNDDDRFRYLDNGESLASRRQFDDRKYQIRREEKRKLNDLQRSYDNSINQLKHELVDTNIKYNETSRFVLINKKFSGLRETVFQNTEEALRHIEVDHQAMIGREIEYDINDSSRKLTESINIEDESRILSSLTDFIQAMNRKREHLLKQYNMNSNDGNEMQKQKIIDELKQIRNRLTEMKLKLEDNIRQQDIRLHIMEHMSDIKKGYRMIDIKALDIEQNGISDLIKSHKVEVNHEDLQINYGKTKGDNDAADFFAKDFTKHEYNLKNINEFDDEDDEYLDGEDDDDNAFYDASSFDITDRVESKPIHRHEQSKIIDKKKLSPVFPSINRKSLKTYNRKLHWIPIWVTIVIGLSLIAVIVIVISVVIRRYRILHLRQQGFQPLEQNKGNNKNELSDFQRNGYENPTYNYYEQNGGNMIPALHQPLIT
ncbi:hypothetical protein SNEBB_002513 [Seison nebaliae]|nr:hypothetical protein SNEBB_002513 [Seison nebaliae]